MRTLAPVALAREPETSFRSTVSVAQLKDVEVATDALDTTLNVRNAVLRLRAPENVTVVGVPVAVSVGVGLEVSVSVADGEEVGVGVAVSVREGSAATVGVGLELAVSVALGEGLGGELPGTIAERAAPASTLPLATVPDFRGLAVLSNSCST